MNTNSVIAEIFNRYGIATQKCRTTDILGNDADRARALGGYGEWVNRSEQTAVAIKRGMEETRRGNPALLEFIIFQETRISRL